MSFKIVSLQWGAGVYCAFTGLLMLVVPHQFLAPSYAALQPQLWLWGLLLLPSGIFLLSVALLKLPRRAVIIAHSLVGAALLVLAAGFVSSQNWTGTISLGVLAIGTLVAALPLRRTKYQVRSKQPALGTGNAATSDSQLPLRDLLSTLVGFGMMGIGLLMVLAPAQYSAPLYLPLRPILTGYGLAFALGGGLLVYQQLRPGRPGSTTFAWIAQLVGGGVLFSFVPIVIVARTWSGIPYYGFIAILVALNPLQDRIRWRINGGALRTRLALIMGLVAAVPVILITASFSSRMEEVTRLEALTNMQVLASALASSVHNYAYEHRNAVLTLAANTDLMALSPAAQRSLLQTTARSYPDIVAFSTFDPNGNPIARSDNLPPTALQPTMLANVRAASGPFATVLISTLLHRPVFVFAAPVTRADGTLSGYIFVSVESARISDTLTKSNSAVGVTVYLVDYKGRVIAHPDPALVARFEDLSNTAPVAAFLESPTVSGSLSSGPPATEQLAGYAGVPGMGWGVIVGQPVATALAVIHADREKLLVLALFFLVVAAAVGVLVARGMTSPLSDLVSATTALAAGDQGSPMPISGISELDRLAGAFGEMRERIALRTDERERAQAALQALNAELERLVEERTAALHQINSALVEKARDLESSNSALAQFAYVASHDLREPLRMMASYSQLLARRYKGQIDKRADTFIDYITEGATRMQSLLDDLLTYTRIGGEVSALGPMSLEETIGQALQNLQLVVAESDATVSHEKLPAVLSDQLRLTLVFQNLIHNAIKFHGVQKPVVNITARRSDQHWEICVRDNGIGIEPQYQERIFTIFQRLHSRQEFAGNGIGLAVVKKMVEDQGGRIWMESAQGQGSAFFFTVQALKD